MNDEYAIDPARLLYGAYDATIKQPKYLCDKHGMQAPGLILTVTPKAIYICGLCYADHLISTVGVMKYE